MRITKFFIAFALFVSSVTFEEQITASKVGLSSNWDVSISMTNESFALEMAKEVNLY